MANVLMRLIHRTRSNRKVFLPRDLRSGGRLAARGLRRHTPRVDRHDERCCFDAWAAADARRARSGKRVSGISRDLIEALDAVGLRGRSVLDLGCGAGGVAIETVARGADSATGLDLSQVAIEEARALAAASGTGGRTSFDVGDGSIARLGRHDVVILNRVVCCYPRVEALLANSLSATGWVYALTAPPSSGWRGVLARALLRVENAWYWVRRSRFRAFVHDLRRIDGAILGAGFREIDRRTRLAWDLRVYLRDVPDDARVARVSAASVTAPAH